MNVFSKRQLDLITETIVSVMWTKREVFDFLEECDVPKSTISGPNSEDIQHQTKRQILQAIFEELQSRPDKGTPQFRSMAEQLVEWKDFNPRRFGPAGELDRGHAQSAIDALRTTLGMAEVRASDSGEKRSERAEMAQKSLALLELKKHFFDLAQLSSGKLTPQARGLEFETLLNKLFLISGIPSEGPFRAKELQIDGSFKFDNHHYVLEAKWTHSSESAESLLDFAQKVDNNMDGRGLFISINGFSDFSILSLNRARIRDVILMDGRDLCAILEERLSLKYCIEEKIRAAQTRGELYFDPITKLAKSQLSMTQYN